MPVFKAVILLQCLGLFIVGPSLPAASQVPGSAPLSLDGVIRTRPFSNPLSEVRLAQQTKETRTTPKSSQELWERWVQLIDPTQGDVNKARFERVTGLPLPDEKREANDFVQYSLTMQIRNDVPGRDAGRLFAAITSGLKQPYEFAEVEWETRFFASGALDTCVSMTNAIADLDRIGWGKGMLDPLPPPHVKQDLTWWPRKFRKGSAQITYAGGAQRCRATYRSRLPDPPAK